jgi:hypothetical protein
MADRPETPPAGSVRRLTRRIVVGAAAGALGGALLEPHLHRLWVLPARDRMCLRVAGDDDAPGCDAAELRCTFERHPERLELGYWITNVGREPLTALVKIPRREVDFTRSYDNNVFVDRVGGAVHLLKAALTLPRGMDPDEDGCPLGITLVPGETYAEVLRLSLPLKLRNRYRAAARKGEHVIAAEPARATMLVFTVGILSDAGSPNPWRHVGHPELREVWLPARVHERQTLISRHFELDEALPLLDYKAFNES